MKLIKCFYLILLVGFILINPLSARALIAPQIYITELNLSNESSQIFSPGDKIEGQITLWNYEELLIPDLKIRFELSGPNGLMEIKKSNEIFAIPAKQEITKDFNYRIPGHVPSENLILRIQITNSRGEEFAWIDYPIRVKNEIDFIKLDDFGFLKNESLIHPGSGSVWQPSEQPEITFQANNDSEKNITAYPLVRFYRYHLNSPISEQRYPDFVISAQEKISHNLTLPLMEEPSSYLAELVLCDAETDKAISNLILYRWVVSGRSAQILSLQADNSLYRRNEEALIKIQLVGSADHDIPLQQGTVKVSIYDQLDNLVGESQQKDTSLVGGQEVTIVVPIQEDVINPKIVAAIHSGGAILDEYEAISQVKPSRTQLIAENWWIKYQEELLLLIAVLITLMALAFYFGSDRDKGKDKKQKAVMLICFFLLVFAHSTQAATEVTGGCCDTYMQFVSPLPPSKQKPAYFPGEEINFTGSFKVGRSHSALFFNKISFYITENKDIPTADCCYEPEEKCQDVSDCLCPNTCHYANGAKSKIYTIEGIKNIKWCNQARSLNEKAIDPDTGKNYQIYKLGDAYLEDSPRLDKSYAVEYSQDFKIPEGLPFSGPVRFYVVYSGTHLNNHWHWSVVYQEGYIAQKPIIKETWEEWDYVNAPLQPILNWNYYSQNDHLQTNYQIVLSDKADFQNSIITTEAISSSANSYGILPNLLSWNQTYYWRVRAQDNHNQWSDWSASSSFKTPLHPYPSVDFDWTPKPIHALRKTQFINQANVYGGASAVKHQWVFWDRAENKTIAVSNNINPLITFEEKGYISITLTITDSSGYSASKTKNVEVRYALADPEETPLSPSF